MGRKKNGVALISQCHSLTSFLSRDGDWATMQIFVKTLCVAGPRPGSLRPSARDHCAVPS